MKRKWKLYSRHRGYYESDEPGQFAAITTQKIAGRLDCHSGKRALSKNRIFLRHLNDIPKGFRYCKICKPEQIQVGDRIECLEKRTKKLEYEPHVSLWATGILRPGTDTYEPCRWYAAMNWGHEQEGRLFSCQHTLSQHYRYHQAFSIALREGKQLNIPVIKHALLDIVILWLPTEASTPVQELLVRNYKARKGVIEMKSSFS